MADIDFTPVTWFDGSAGHTPLTAAAGPNRWEVTLLALANGLNNMDDRVASLEASASSPSSAYRQGQTADAGSPTIGSQLFYNQQTSELWVPGGTTWYKTALTAVSGVSGGSNAPTNFTAVVNPDSSVSLAWTLPTPPGGQTITAVTVREKFQSPGGVSGMPLAGTATTNTRPSSTTAATREYYVTCSFSGGTESAESNHVTVVLPFGAAAVTPASILNIGSGTGQNRFNVGVGYSTGHVDHTMTEIVNGYVENPYFTPNGAQDAVQFQVFANGKTTSSSTDHPRSELREMLADGTTKASWTAGSGKNHRMIGTSKVTHLPADGEASGTPKPSVCFAQIHDGAGDVVRFQVESDSNTVSSLKFRAYTHSPDGNASEVKTYGPSYTINTSFNWMIDVVGTTCSCYVGGTITGTPGNYSYSGGTLVKSFTIGLTGGYFKAGSYAQFSTAVINAHGNPDGGYAASSYAAVELKNLQVTHSPAI